MGVPPVGGVIWTGQGSYFPAKTTGLSVLDDDVIGASVPRLFCATRPVNRVTTAAAGEVPASASARSSTPGPQLNAAGSMGVVVGAHEAPPGTRASTPAAHARPTVPPAAEASRAAASQVGLAWPLASRKYPVESGVIGVSRGTGMPSNRTACDAASRTQIAPPPVKRALERA